MEKQVNLHGSKSPDEGNGDTSYERTDMFTKNATKQKQGEKSKMNHTKNHGKWMYTENQTITNCSKSSKDTRKRGLIETFLKNRMRTILMNIVTLWKSGQFNGAAQ